MTDRTGELRAAIDRVGYYPAVVAEAVESALAGEPAVSYVIHHEPTFDRDEVRRHVTVLVLTASRLVVAHTDEHPPDDLLPAPYASTSTEAIPIDRVGSVAVTRMVANPDERGNERAAVNGASGVGGDGASLSTGEPVHDEPVHEALLTVGWGAVSRVDLEPATCGDPDCVADHGYTGTMTAEDFALRISTSADGSDAVGQLLGFARALSAATVGR